MARREFRPMSTPPATERPVDPFPAGLQRLAAASGIFFAVLLVAVIAISNAETPEIDAPLREWSEYARDNESNLRVSALVAGLAAFQFLWFLGIVRSALGQAEVAARGFTRLAYIVLAGGIVGAAGLVLGTFFGAASAAHADELGPEFVRALTAFSAAAFGLVSVGFATMLYTASFVIMRAGGLCFLLQLGILLSEDFDNAFGVFYPLGFLVLVIWSIGASVELMRRVGRPVA